ncbi:MAG TPA: FdhF/YdeP family oxidoreductase [Thermoanaerobaculia bacterium]|nr:FdhF/YdeP family oxidoreductase [Thermoanaerobaculia bacterium]
MAKPRVAAGGGLAALHYVWRKGTEVGLLALYRRLRSRNTCKTCAVGMGGQRGGMVNEAGHFPEVCKKSVQAQSADMQPAIEEAYFRKTPISAMRELSSRELEALGRVAFPLLGEASTDRFRRISWEEAYERGARALSAAGPERVFFYSSGRSSNEAAFLMQVVARAFGATNINNCSYYCHQASGVALSRVYGSGTASVVLDDMRKADLALVAGANPASNHPRLITQLVELRARGGKVIVVNPVRELGLVRFRVPSLWRSMLFGSKVADVYLQPHAGGDVALLKALLKGLLERGAVDAEYLESYTSGWEAVREDLEASSWESLVDASGVPRESIEEAVGAIAGASRGILLWAMGMTQHAHGVDNVQALANLALARGWLGREGCGLLPIRGHSNVQGVGSMGVTPEMKKAFAARMEQAYGIRQFKGGLDTYGCMLEADAGNIEACFLLGGNLLASNPDRKWAEGALRRIPVAISVTTKLNEHHVHAVGREMLILPALARDEEAQATTQESMFNFVRLSEGGLPSVRGEMRSEVEILASLAERILPPDRLDWRAFRSHARLRQEIAKIVPGFESMERIDRGEEFQIEGRTWHQPRFGTEDGRARLAVTPLPPPLVRDGELRLMTLRSEGQFNTVVYEDEDLYRGTSRRDVVMISEADAARLGVREGERVRVETAAGSMEAIVSLLEIRPGNVAMYYPEANVLVPRSVDPGSKTPAFKSVAARIAPLGRPIESV